MRFFDGGYGIIVSMNPANGNNRKRFVIVVVILLVVIIAVAVGVWLGTRKSDGGGENGVVRELVTVSENTKKAFNGYANYLFYGEESTETFEPISGWYDVNELSSVVGATNAEWQKEYFEKLEKLQDVFVEEVKVDYPEENEDATSLIYEFQALVGGLSSDFDGIQESMKTGAIDELNNAVNTLLRKCMRINVLIDVGVVEDEK